MSEPTEPDPVPLVSTVTTRRRWRPMPTRSIVWLDWEAGEVCDVGGRPSTVAPRAQLGDVLASCSGVETLYVVGLAAPAVVHAWAIEAAPAGWVARGAYLDDVAPVVTFTRAGDERRTVRVAVAAQWLGRGDYTASQAAAGWRCAEQLLQERFPNSRMQGTPATTGRELIARTIPDGAAWPTLSDEVQELLRSTSGQGRAELYTRPGVELPGMVELDMRLAYAAVAWGMPVGEPRRFTGGGADYDPRARGRYRVRWSVPAGWDRPGLLPAMREGGGWWWPHEPGEEAAGWVDSAELALAAEHGWAFTIDEGITWAQTDNVLRRWADKIADAASEADRLARNGRLELHAGAAARHALRAIVLYTIGALHGTRHDITRSCSFDEAGALVPANAIGQQIVGERIVWRERGPAAWPEMSRPEWSSTIWARTRCRLLDARGVGPQRVGALHLDPAHVIGFRTDALYVVDDPGWHDDGKPGRYRAKGAVPHPFTMPTTMEQLDAIRGAGASPTHGIAAARAALRGDRHTPDFIREGAA